MTTFTGSPAQDDVFEGGAGSDLFLFNVADLNGSDIVAGNGGFDTLGLSGTGALTPASLAGVRSIAALTLANGGISVAFSNDVANAFAGRLLVNGSSGDDTVDYAAVTLATRSIDVIAGAGNDTFLGGAGYDVFHFNVADLTGGDHVSGGGGSAIDQLYFDTAGTITAASLVGVSGIERYLLAAGTNAITLGVASAAGVYNTIIQVFGNTGDDTIDATALAPGAHVETTSGAGLDTVSGSAGDDVFRFGAGDLAGDTVNGNSGYDTVYLSGADTLTVADLAGLANIDQITLHAGGSAVMLDDAVAAANAASLAIWGTAGNDTVDASAVTLTTRSVLVTALGGSDTLLGGAGKDAFRFNVADLDSSDTVSGGDGAAIDTIHFMTAGTVATTAFAHVSGIEQLTLVAGTNAVAINDVLVSTAYNQRLTIQGNTGNDTIDAASLTAGFDRIVAYGRAGDDTLRGGAGIDTLYGGDGADTIDGNGGGDDITGGAGADTLRGGGGGDEFFLYNKDFVSGESIDGGAGSDRIRVGASTNFTIGTIANVETLLLRAANADGTLLAQPVSVTLTGAQAAGFTLIGGGYTYTDKLTINVASGSTADFGQLSLDGFTSPDTVLIKGAAGNETITGPGYDAYSFDGKGAGFTINAGAGNDTLRIGDAIAQSWAGHSNIDGGEGDDRIDYGLGSETDVVLDGGNGNDTLAVGSTTAFPDYLTIDLRGGDQTIGDTMQVQNFENVDWTGASGLYSYFSLTVVGTNGANVISGGGGADTIDGGGGADIINGYGGNDRITYQAGAILLAGGVGTDTLLVAGGTHLDLSAVDTGGDGTVTGFEILDASAATAGVTLHGSNVAATTLIGGSGDDTLTVSNYGASITGGGGADTLSGGDGKDSFYLYGGDFVSGESIDGHSSDDSLYVRASTDLSTGTVKGVESLVLGASDAGGNTLYQTDSVILTGAQASQLHLITAGPDDIDTIETVTVNVASGTSADMSLLSVVNFQTQDSFIINGAEGNESIVAPRDGPAVTIHGNVGNDILKAAGSDDYGHWTDGSLVYGDAGNDRIDYGYTSQSNVTLDGGTGSDTLTASASGGLYDTLTIFDLGQADQSIGDATLVRNFENFDWTGADTYFYLKVTGSTAANAISGGELADTIDGGGGADIIDGKGGSDSITYRADAVSISGGAPSRADEDSLVLFGAANIDLGAADQSIGDSVIVTDFENVEAMASTEAVTVRGGESAKNFLHGGSGDDTLSLGNTYGGSVLGDAGNDIINGGNVIDYLYGNDGADTLWGGGGDDMLKGDAGDDTLDGGSGADVLIGDAGSDLFRWSGRDGSKDVVADFTSADDTLQFASSLYHFNGAAFDVAVDDTTGHAAIGSADLIRYTGSALNSVADVASYLATNATGAAAGGVFVLGVNGAGHTVLYHVADPDLSTGGDVVVVADFGTTVTPATLALSDFVFFAG